jgi:hypothetical protein
MGNEKAKYDSSPFHEVPNLADLCVQCEHWYRRTSKELGLLKAPNFFLFGVHAS